LLAVFECDACAHDIARAGWPFRFYERAGVARTLALLMGLLVSRPKNSAQIKCLCYNAANMQYQPDFANNNNNNDNDDHQIVGRSLAG
jgi:hypothetical protein